MSILMYLHMLVLVSNNRITMILQRLFRLSSAVQSAISVSWRRNIGITAVAFNKELDPVHKQAPKSLTYTRKAQNIARYRNTIKKQFPVVCFSGKPSDTVRG